MLLGFEHVGMTAIDLDRTIAFYCGMLGLTLALRKPTERGEVAFLDTGSGMLEIFSPNADIARSRDVPLHEAGIGIKAQHLESAVFISLVEPLQSCILGRKAALAGSIHHQQHVSRILAQADRRAIQPLDLKAMDCAGIRAHFPQIPRRTQDVMRLPAASNTRAAGQPGSSAAHAPASVK